MSRFFTLILLLCLNLNLFSQIARPMHTELARLGVDRALLIPNVSIDYYPIWSPDNQFIGINLNDIWFQFDLSETTMVLADVREEVIGYNSFVTLDSLKDSQVDVWKSATNYDPRKVKTSDGYTYELKMVGLRTSFVETDPKGNKTEHFITDGENNHSLSVSPDERFIAFIAEMNGLMIFVRNQADLKSSVSRAEKAVSEALNYLDKGDLRKGQKLLEQAIKKDPKNDEAYFLLSQLICTDTNLDECLSTALKAIELAPNKAYYLTWLSEIYGAREEYHKSIESLKKYLEMKPTEYDVYYDIARYYLLLKDSENTCKYYDLTRHYYPDFTDEDLDETCE